MHLGNPHFSLWEIAQEIFVAIVVTFKNLFTLGTCFQVFYSISILWLHMANNAQSLVNYLEKIVMATNSSGLTWIQPICQEQRERERRERQRARINRWRASANFNCSIWWQSFVSSYYVLTVFLHWNYKMKYSCYQLRFFVILGWLFTWFLVEKCAAWQKVVANHCFQKNIYISILTLPAHTASLALGKIQKLLAAWADRWFWKVN